MPAKNRTRLSAKEQRARKQQVLTHKKPSQVESIADALVIKDEDIFFLSEQDGQVPMRGHHGFGLYFHDCRFLNGYEFKLAKEFPVALLTVPRKGSRAVHEMTSPGFRADDGRSIEKEDIAINWLRLVDAGRHMLNDRITFQNYRSDAVEVPISLTFRAEFEDIFVVRGLLGAKLGKLHPPSWDDGVLHFFYEGSDGLYRSVQVHLSTEPEKIDGPTAHFRIQLPARESAVLRVSILLAESTRLEDVQSRTPPHFDAEQIEAEQGHSSDRWVGNQTQFHSDSRPLNEIMDRSLRDLRILRSRLEGKEFFSAGTPWFATLFGRDSIIASLQTLAYEPAIAEQTLQLLAHYQGTEVNKWRDEQPGKIMHELRVGELARKGEIPYTPYYGSIDSTPLFLILLARHAAWTGKLDLFRELRDNVERALKWMTKYGDSNGDGYLEYQSTSKKGLINQGWKDSGDGIVNADGSLARPPIAMVEVQGYAYQARLSMADLFERDGDGARADQLRKEAQALRDRFNRAFWLPDTGFYAMALQQGGEPAAVVSSNPGQAMWSGIVAPEHARQVVDRLMADDMFSGWGVRTLSAKEQRYNPIAYHLGTVWPHDNSIIAAGFRNYGFDDAAARVFLGIMDAAIHFPAYRLPEVFSGFSRQEFGLPVRYAVACHPQAWASGSVPFMVQTLLGLMPEAFDQRLRIVRPMLPDMIDQIELRQLRIGDAEVDLRFRRTEPGTIDVQVLKQTGTLDVRIERDSSGGTG